MSNTPDNLSNPYQGSNRLLSLLRHPVTDGALTTLFISAMGAATGSGISYLLSSSPIKGAIIGTGISAAFLAAHTGGEVIGDKMVDNAGFTHAPSKNLEFGMKKRFAAAMFSLMTTVTASAGLYWTPATSSAPQAPAPASATPSPASSAPLSAASIPKIK